MSSWQPYVDNNLVGSKKLTKAAIISAADGTVWASSSGFSPSPLELKSLLAAFTDAAAIRADGLKIGGTKYIVINSGDGRSVYAKKGDDGVVAVKTKQTVLLGIFSAPIVAGEAAKVVECVADYLISVNF